MRVFDPEDTFLASNFPGENGMQKLSNSLSHGVKRTSFLPSKQSSFVLAEWQQTEKGLGNQLARKKPSGNQSIGIENEVGLWGPEHVSFL
eukprot:jgi/Bigna1/140471/aug1.56_g15179